MAQFSNLTAGTAAIFMAAQVRFVAVGLVATQGIEEKKEKNISKIYIYLLYKVYIRSYVKVALHIDEILRVPASLKSLKGKF